MAWSALKQKRRKALKMPSISMDDDDDTGSKKEKPFELSDYDTVTDFDDAIEKTADPELAEQAERDSVASTIKRRKKAMDNEGYA